uniref:Uncharacterized protein AlNc14C223G9159 n=1 Tax=Albugo laibachii Nc14 TaxID=890382 RepID=F0WS17_9STRA|nr:conserved hypothetical protein [Albugo laibachii Nc14]|eukprot:CCA24135.1 conserved hypothetical protein [Albugo laibachii Nc14]
MKGVTAVITSCLGGRSEIYAIRVEQNDAMTHFVYKNLHDFELLWENLQRKNENACMKSSSRNKCVVHKWLSCFMERFGYQTVLKTLRTQNKEIITFLNFFLQIVVQRMTSLYTDPQNVSCPEEEKFSTIIETFLKLSSEQTAPLHPFQFNMRHEPTKDHKYNSGAPIFPERCENVPQMYPSSTRFSPRKRRCSTNLEILTMKHTHDSIRMAASLPTRRRVFAEVDF